MEHHLPLNRGLGRLDLCFHVYVHFAQRVLADSAMIVGVDKNQRPRNAELQDLSADPGASRSCAQCDVLYAIATGEREGGPFRASMTD